MTNSKQNRKASFAMKEIRKRDEMLVEMGIWGFKYYVAWKINLLTISHKEIKDILFTN